MRTNGEWTNYQDVTETQGCLLIRAGLEAYMGKENSQEHLEQIQE